MKFIEHIARGKLPFWAVFCSLGVLGHFGIGFLVSGAALAQDRPPPPADTRAAPNKPGWSVDERSGCWVWRQYPQPEETVHWSGNCGAGGRAAGRGTLELRYGGKVTRYEGDLRDGKRHGRRVQSYASGNRYEGDWRDDKRDGRGVFAWVSGARYEGAFQDDKQTGHGVQSYANGARREGEFRDGKLQGRGVETLRSGARYDGEWRDGRKHGRGVQTYANGMRYEGGWQNGLADGFGTLVEKGQKYSGNWTGGCFSGGGRRIAMGRPISECR